MWRISGCLSNREYGKVFCLPSNVLLFACQSLRGLARRCEIEGVARALSVKDGAYIHLNADWKVYLAGCCECVCIHGFRSDEKLSMTPGNEHR